MDASWSFFDKKNCHEESRPEIIVKLAFLEIEIITRNYHKNLIRSMKVMLEV